jgi:hypothetical protein
MTKKPLPIVAIASIALVLTACPGTTGTQLSPDRAREISIFGPSAMTGTTSFLRGAPVTAESIGREVQRLARSNPQFATFVDRYTPHLNNAFKAVRPQGPGTDCGNNISPNTYKDVDADGIYQSPSGGTFTYTFDCTNTDLYGGTGALSGQVTMRDDVDDTTPASAQSGYTYKLSNFKFTYTTSVDDINGNPIPVTLILTLNTNATIAKTSVPGKYQVTQNYTFGFDASAGTAKLTATLSNNTTLTYTPTSATAPSFDQGYVDASSQFTYSIAGRLDTTSFNGGGTFNVLYSNMYVDRGSGCDDVTQAPPTANKDAKVVFSDNAPTPNRLTWDITGCGTGTWTYAGS